MGKVAGLTLLAIWTFGAGALFGMDVAISEACGTERYISMPQTLLWPLAAVAILIDGGVGERKAIPLCERVNHG